MKYNNGDFVECSYANGTRFIGTVSSEDTVNISGTDYKTNFDSWKEFSPLKTDVCWFIIDNVADLGIIEKIDKGYFYKAFKDDEIYFAERVEPFFGKLPTIYKDKITV